MSTSSCLDNNGLYVKVKISLYGSVISL